jgi:hypothetical protein
VGFELVGSVALRRAFSRAFKNSWRSGLYHGERDDLWPMVPGGAAENRLKFRFWWERAKEAAHQSPR